MSDSLSHMGKRVINNVILLSSLKQTRWGIDYVRDTFKNTYALNELRPAPLSLWQVGTGESSRSNTCSSGSQCKVVVGSSAPTYNCSTLDTQLLRVNRCMHTNSVPPLLSVPFPFFPLPLFIFFSPITSCQHRLLIKLVHVDFNATTFQQFQVCPVPC